MPSLLETAATVPLQGEVIVDRTISLEGRCCRLLAPFPPVPHLRGMGSLRPGRAAQRRMATPRSEFACPKFLCLRTLVRPTGKGKTKELRTKELKKQIGNAGTERSGVEGTAPKK